MTEMLFRTFTVICTRFDNSDRRNVWLANRAKIQQTCKIESCVNLVRFKIIYDKSFTSRQRRTIVMWIASHWGHYAHWSLRTFYLKISNSLLLMNNNNSNNTHISTWIFASARWTAIRIQLVAIRTGHLAMKIGTRSRYWKYDPFWKCIVEISLVEKWKLQKTFLWNIYTKITVAVGLSRVSSRARLFVSSHYIHTVASIVVTLKQQR